MDPFVLLEKKDNQRASGTELPCVDASDLVSYFILHLTAKQFKCCKSLEAYNQFACGWVKDIINCLESDKTVVTENAPLLHLCCYR